MSYSIKETMENYELLQYLGRSIVTYLNSDHKRFNIYKSKAMQLHKEVEFEESCRYPMENMIPKESVEKLKEILG